VSDADVELIRAMFEVFNRGGVDAALPYFDEEVEWIAPPDWLYDPIYRGHEGLRRLASQWTAIFDDYQLLPQRFLPADDHLVVLITQRGRMKPSGDLIEQPIGYNWHIRDGKTVRVKVHFSWEAALEEAGLS